MPDTRRPDEEARQTCAVLVLAYNRPEILARTLSALKQAGPSRVYVSVDGPKEDVPSDRDRVQAVRRVVNEFSWDCPSTSRFSELNGGLGQGVLDAISWFFEHEEEGIVLEDDVFIAPGSLELAATLLRTFRDDDGVGSVSLFNAVPKSRLTCPECTYRLSRLPSSQYWGTWRDRWQQLVPDLSDWRNWLSEEHLVGVGGKRFAQRYGALMDEEVAQSFTAWEGLWIATHWRAGWNVVTTNSNSSLHLGFGPNASNSTEQPSWYPTSTDDWSGDVNHPTNASVDASADQWMVNQRFGLSPWKRLKHRVGVMVPWLRKLWRQKSVRPIG